MEDHIGVISFVNGAGNAGAVADMKILFIILSLLFIPFTVLATNYGDDANCMGYWPMEEDGNETDLSGEGETLIETGGDIPQDADKKFGDYSRDFEDGDFEYLTHADGGSTDISGADQKMSWVAFIKMEEDSGTHHAQIISKADFPGDATQYFALWRSASDDAMQFVIQKESTSTFTEAVSGTSLVITTWYGVAGVYNDTDIRIYVDGSLDSNGASNPKACTHGNEDQTAPFVVGVGWESGAPDGARFDGLIDDLAIFDRELTSVEVSDINTNGVVGAAAVRQRVII